MKIIRNGVAYLQKYDIATILQGIPSFPVTIMDELSFAQSGIFFTCDLEKEGLEFHAFTNKANVRWIREQNWLLNWNELIGLTPTELEQHYLEHHDALERKINQFNQAPSEYRDENWGDFNVAATKENHVVDSYGIMLEYVQGKRYFALPAGIAEYPHLSLRARLMKVSHHFTHQ